MNVGRLTSIWRYPVKSQRGEALDTVEVEASGLHGDRTSAYLIRSERDPRAGKEFRGKENDRLHLTTGDAAIRELAAEKSIEIERRDGERFFDAAAISILVDRWLEALSVHVAYAVEPLRFRPNFYVTADAAFDEGEAALEGRTLQVGNVVLRVRKPIERCVVPNYDLNGGQTDHRILQFLAQNRNTSMGIYCDVLEPGTVKLGDALEAR